MFTAPVATGAPSGSRKLAAAAGTCLMVILVGQVSGQLVILGQVNTMFAAPVATSAPTSSRKLAVAAGICLMVWYGQVRLGQVSGQQVILG